MTWSSEFCIQVAGVYDADEAVGLAEEGVTHVGIPLGLDYHAEDVTPGQARDIAQALRAWSRGSGRPVGVVLITYFTEAEAVLALARAMTADAVQSHGQASPEVLAAVRRAAPDLAIIKSLVVGRRSGGEFVADHAWGAASKDGVPAGLEDELQAFAPIADAFLTDTFDPATGASGATGRTHDWGVSRRLVELSPRPVILAGGLTPENVAAAVKAVRPAGVDAHTGLEDPAGRKSREKVRRFVLEAKRAVASFSGTV